MAGLVTASRIINLLCVIGMRSSGAPELRVPFTSVVSSRSKNSDVPYDSGNERLHPCRNRSWPEPVLPGLGGCCCGRLASLAATDARHRNRLRRAIQCRQIEPDQRTERPKKPCARLAHPGPNTGADFLYHSRGTRRASNAGLRLCRRG